MSKGGPRYYTGSPPSRCDLCPQQLTAIFYDAVVPKFGTWGNICATCFDVYECKLGTGSGQEYELQGDGRWMKTDG